MKPKKMVHNRKIKDDEKLSNKSISYANLN